MGLFIALVFGLSDLANPFRTNRAAVGAITIAALSILIVLPPYRSAGGATVQRYLNTPIEEFPTIA